MKDKINVAELLKDCPKGMELDCTMFEDVKFIDVDEADKPICIRTGDIYRYLTKFGTWTFDENAKCVIFPKGKTTWEGFQKPFKDGDILHIDCTDESDDKQHEYIFILNRIYNGEVHSYCHYYMHDGFYHRTSYLADDTYPIRFATEEEKQKLFQAIKDNGYKWNPDDKTLEKIDYQYPKTYEECCRILDNHPNTDYVEGYKWKLMMNSQKLLICRDAYWKIAGEQMGLGKPWKPEKAEIVHAIFYNFYDDVIDVSVFNLYDNVVLCFPTEEMRDVFYENFKDLIMKCKELL